MGLDMYLHRKTYVGEYDENKEVDISRETLEKQGVSFNKIEYIEEQSMYWRKANAIHNWFVKNVQDGEDDCREYYVSNEQLRELLETINKVLDASEMVDGDVCNSRTCIDGKWISNMESGKVVKDTSVARKLLPTTEGFFFGGVEYDEYYIETLETTRDCLSEVLSRPDNSFYYYHSSW